MYTVESSFLMSFILLSSFSIIIYAFSLHNTETTKINEDIRALQQEYSIEATKHFSEEKLVNILTVMEKETTKENNLDDLNENLVEEEK